ncbi:MAG: methyltransferase [Planctomycetota bacterium]|nr:methyltransferase [Planctomycetota bacterium]
MTGRERVRAALTFSSPDRAPRDIWALPAITRLRKKEFDALCRKYPMDIQGAPGTPAAVKSEPDNPSGIGRYTDDWGSMWQVAELGVVGEVKAPVLADWSRLAGFRPPWHLIQSRSAADVNRVYAGSDRFVVSECTARPFERLQVLCGTEKVFLDLAYGTRELLKLLEIVHDYYLKDIEWWCRTDVDAVTTMDDWGTNKALLISPATWRAVFKPLYRDYCRMIHRAGKFAFFHTDGHTAAIYGDLIEVGMDAINSQLFCMDIEELARRYKGQVTFWGEIDRQHVLPFGTPAEVRQAVMRVRRALDDGRGGVIAQCEWGKNNPRRNIDALYKAWLEPGPPRSGTQNRKS